jgi:hypothetical protein
MEQQVVLGIREMLLAKLPFWDVDAEVGADGRLEVWIMPRAEDKIVPIHFRSDQRGGLYLELTTELIETRGLEQ